MINIIIWIMYGLIVGSIAKWLHPGEDPVGIVNTIIVGISGSIIGGIINYFANGAYSLTPAGALMGIVGGVIFCWIYRKYRIKKYLT